MDAVNGPGEGAEPRAVVDPDGGPAPTVSVVVPFRDAERHLPVLLQALVGQEGVDPTTVECLFVDNDSTDAGPELVRDAVGHDRPAGRLLARTGIASSYAARNTGVAAATGDVLAFTDADCRPHPTWLAAIVDHFRDPDHGRDVVAGAVDLELDDPTSVWELFDHAVHLDNEAMATHARVATANMAVRRDLFARVGPFEEVSSGADHQWSQRASDLGARIRFVDTVRVAHPTRRSRAALLAKAERTSRGQGEMAARDPGHRWTTVLRALGRPLLVHRHVAVARTPAARGGLGLRARLFVFSVAFRTHQVPAFFAGWRAGRRG